MTVKQTVCMLEGYTQIRKKAPDFVYFLADLIQWELFEGFVWNNSLATLYVEARSWFGIPRDLWEAAKRINALIWGQFL